MSASLIGITTFYYHRHNHHNHYEQNPSMVGLCHVGKCDDDDDDDVLVNENGKHYSST